MLAVAVVVALVIGPLSSSGEASGTDFAAGATSQAGPSDAAPACISARGGQSPYTDCARMHDTDDTTLYQTSGGSSVHDDQYCVDVGAGKSVTNVRLLIKSDSVPWSGYYIEGTNGITTWGATQCGHGTGTDGWTTVTHVTSVTADMTTTFGSVQSYRWWRISSVNATGPCGSCVMSFEVRGNASVAGTTYVYDVRMGTGLLSKTMQWRWKLGYAGSWTLTSGGSTGVAHCFRATGRVAQWNDGSCTASMAAGAEAGDGILASDYCTIAACGPWTLAITDTTRGQTATYTFPSAGEGVLVGGLVPPVITSLAFCYQATASQCMSVPGFAFMSAHTAVGQLAATYTFTGDPATSYTIALGQASAVYPLPAMASGYGTDTQTPCVAGVASCYIVIAGDTAGAPIAVLRISGPGAESTWGSSALDFTNGGRRVADVTPVAGDGPAACDFYNPICGIQRVFDVGRGALWQLIDCGDQTGQTCTGGMAAVKAAALTRQPFNFVARAASGVAAQIARAQAATVTSSTCAGIALTVPTPAPVVLPSGNPYGAVATVPPILSPLSFSVLKCADLEPWGGSSWWQAIRTAMDPAVFLGYAFVWFRKLQPTVTLQG